MIPEERAKEKSERLHAYFTQLRGACEKSGEVIVKDELSELTIETYTSPVGVRYKVLKRDDVVLSILYLSDAVKLSRALMHRGED